MAWGAAFGAAPGAALVEGCCSRSMTFPPSHGRGLAGVLLGDPAGHYPRASRIYNAEDRERTSHPHGPGRRGGARSRRWRSPSAPVAAAAADADGLDYSSSKGPAARGARRTRAPRPRSRRAGRQRGIRLPPDLERGITPPSPTTSLFILRRVPRIGHCTNTLLGGPVRRSSARDLSWTKVPGQHVS